MSVERTEALRLLHALEQELAHFSARVPSMHRDAHAAIKWLAGVPRLHDEQQAIRDREIGETAVRAALRKRLADLLDAGALEDVSQEWLEATAREVYAAAEVGI